MLMQIQSKIAHSKKGVPLAEHLWNDLCGDDGQSLPTRCAGFLKCMNQNALELTKWKIAWGVGQ